MYIKSNKKLHICIVRHNYTKIRRYITVCDEDTNDNPLLYFESRSLSGGRKWLCDS